MWLPSIFHSSHPPSTLARRIKGAVERRLVARRLLLEGLEDRSLLAFHVLAEYPAGDNPRELTIAQIDAGSQPDLVLVVNSRVGVRLSAADGSFGDSIVSDGEVIADHVVTGDLTNDGVTDLVIAQYNQLSPRIGNGNGTFQERQSFALPAQWESAITGIGVYNQSLSSIATGDLNKDGNLDLIVGGSTSFPTDISCGYYSCGYSFSYNGYVNVLLGNGAGSFDYFDADPRDADLQAHPLGAYRWPAAIAVADLNNDDQADVVTTSGFDVSVLLGDDTGDLKTPVHSGSGNTHSSIVLGDVDGDGNLDAVSQNGNTLIVQKGQGDGRFVPAASVNLGQRVDSVVVGDVNADGKLDLVAVGSSLCTYYGYFGCYDATSTRQASVVLGNGLGGFSLPITSSLGTISQPYSRLIDAALADLTGDGLPELVAIDADAGVAIIAGNDGDWAAPAELSISSVSVVEGNDGTVAAVLAVMLTGEHAGAVTVDYSTADYTAVSGWDYKAQSATLLFGPGIASQTITVPVHGDRIGEGEERFVVNLSNPTGALIRQEQGIVTIVDNEPGMTIDHPLGVDALRVVEGDVGTTPAVFTVTLSTPYDQEVTVDYRTLTGHINDIIAAAGTLRFAPGETLKTITVEVVGDLIYEDLEAFNLYLENASPNVFIASGAGYCLIIDNDPPPPEIAISNAWIVEGDSGTRPMTFTVSLSQASSQHVQVSYGTANGTARKNKNDYVATSGTLNFAPGETTQTITVTIKGDTKVENDEYFYVNLWDAVNATLAVDQGVGTILNDDGVDNPTDVLPMVVSVDRNYGMVDPLDLPAGPPPGDWARQHSDIRTLSILFNKPIVATASDLQLTNLGANAPIDDDQVIALTDAQLSINGNRLTIRFAANALPDGVYRLEVLSTLNDVAGNPLDGDGDGVAGDSYLIQGDATNTLYKLTADWNGDAGTSVFDFPTFAYWFGTAVGSAPDYVDLNNDAGVSIFDFPVFSATFGRGIIYPPPLLRSTAVGSETGVIAAGLPRSRQHVGDSTTDAKHSTDSGQPQSGSRVAEEIALLEVLAEWNHRFLGL